ncbi:MAG: HAD family hydrolase [Planctomycetaceae bacterium]
MALKTCLFDLGNVLLFFSHDLMCRQVGEVMGRTEAEVKAALLETDMQIRFETGQATAAEIHAHFDKLFGSNTALPEFEHAISAIFELNEPMIPLLDELKSAGIRLVLLSNTCSSHFEYAKRTYDFLDKFDDFTLSYAAGAMKPSPRIYEDAISRIQCEPQECFYTDDIAEYVYAAQDFGLNAAVFKNAEATREELINLGAPLDRHA